MSKLLPLLLFVLLLLGAASSAQAAEKFCTDYGGMIDGNDPQWSAGAPVQITIDDTCTFQNWPQSNPLTTTINFQTNDPSIYLIIFDNVWYDGNMACSNIPHRLWVVNSEEGSFSGSCQDIIIPAESIDKQSPAATATIGLPFTYRLTLPSMTYPAGDPSDNDLGAIEAWDDLTATGADLTLVPGGLTAYYKGTSTSVPITVLGDSTDKYLHFALPNIDAGQQVVVEMTVVLEDVPTNVPGTQFTNTATWKFARWIDLDEDGVRDANEYFNPLPGESGISAPMTIVAPNLVVDKFSTATALNLDDTATFNIDVQNRGGGDAWNATIEDQIPVGMCDYDPTTTLSAKIIDVDGVTEVRTLAPVTDYSPTYSGCQLSLSLTDAAGPIAADQHLSITYQSQLDPASSPTTPIDGTELTNIAGATRWYSADSSQTGRSQFDRTLTDGTPLISDDHEDSQTVTAALHGYYFEKTVENLTSLENPATTAAPGDTLHYKLRVFNVDENINAVTINDPIDLTVFDPATFGNVSIAAGVGYNTTWSFDSSTGLFRVEGEPDLNVDVNGELTVEFDVTLRSDLTNGTTVSNQASLDAAGGFTALSDDPRINGVASPDVDGDEDPTDVTIQTPGPLAKANSQPTAAIGERFTYTITVPEIATAVPLYDVQITDDLPANLRFVSAQVVSGGTWTISNSGTGNSLILEDTVTGIDIPANGQAVIAVTAELLNTATNQSGATFTNSATYTYNRANGIDSTNVPGGAGSTAIMTAVEPNLTATKTVRFVSPAGKLPTDPATVGDVLEYVITVPNNGGSTAYDSNIVDTMPANVSLELDSATAQIDGVDVTGFIVNPATLVSGELAWGLQNDDGSLDIPAGQTLVLTYQVTVEDASSVTSFANSVYVDWTSLDGDYPIDPSDNPFPGRERTGEGCPAITAPNDYCAGPASVIVATQDNTSIAKSVFDDSYAETPASTTDPVVRVGDTVTYDLTLNLQEYTTQNVVVEDVLPAGLELVSYTYDPGSTTFNYIPVVEPAGGATGTLTWDFGDIENVPSGDGTPVDPLVIRYVARVVTDPAPTGVDTATSNLLTNTASLSYTGGDPTVYPGRLTATETIEVRQPQMSAISKVDLGSGRFGSGTAGDPYQVNLASDTMQFELSSCNNGLAPAYNVQITDLLASELDETSISTPVVSVGGVTLNAGSDYTYTPPPSRGGSMSFVINTPVNPGECVSIDYSIGFHTDLTAPATWSNEARLPQHESLPAAGRIYSPTELAQVWMTNQVAVEPLTKSLLTPASAEATIGEQAVYQITVPGAPVNAALDNVVVSDTLHGALLFVDATATLDGAPLAITTIQAGQDLSWSIPTIPAGQQAVITLTVRVANNDLANTGTGVINTASYTYDAIPAGSSTDGSSAPLTIIEPAVAIAKTVSNVSKPGLGPNAGDILRYSLTFTAGGGTTGDTFSDAFDLRVEDSLSLGLSYLNGTATVDGTGNTIADPAISGDGNSIPQTLTWDLAGATADIDLPEGTVVTVTYDVLVLDTVVAGQVLSNSAGAQWTGLDGTNADERTGSGSPAYNDYVTGPASTSLIVGDNNSLAKAIVADTYVDASSTASDKIVRIGDTATYRLTLNLDEGTTRSVTVRDVLPTGMAYVGLVGITPASGSGPFTYAVSSQPTVGATGTLTWDLGDVVNTPSNDGTPVDALVIEYQATVQPDAGIAQAPTTGLTNTATLSYLDAGGNPVINATRLVASDTLTVRQPMLSAIVKLGNGAANTASTPLNVNVATDTVQFHLESCNANGLAPAYGVEITDVLASQLDETSVTTPVVAVGGTILNAGTDYTYTPAAARGGTMSFLLNTPVNPSQCVTVDYSIGFHTDFGPNQLWNNSATVDAYWSLPAQSGQSYAPTESSQFYMTNEVSVTPLAKSMETPASGEATIGEDVVYKITVPGTAISGALDNVVVSDTLHGALEYVSATAALDGAPLSITTTQSGQDLSWDIASIPAGQQAEITLTTRVANNDLANAGTNITNTASYTYDGIPAGSVTDGSSNPVTIIEPSVTIAKSVNPSTPPIAGDTLTYAVDLTAASGANFSDAFDAGVEDSLSLGLAYVAGTARVDGAAVEPTVAGDGLSTPQTLTWSGIDIAEGTAVTVTYDVLVLDTVVGGQSLTNSATAQWTGLDGGNSYERSGSGTPAYNDYVTGPATTSLTLEIPSLTVQKVVDKPVANPGDPLHYTITIQNPTGIRLDNFSLVDNVDGLNASPMFQSGSIGNIVMPAGASYVVNGSTLTVSDLGIDPNQSLTIEFDATLATNLGGGTVVLNQAQLQGPWPTSINSDDPNVAGAENPTQTVIPANGVVYDSATREPMGGVTLTMMRASTATALPASCFVDPAQQNQITPANGTYKFDLMFDPTNCPEGEDYLIVATAVPAGYEAEPSLIEEPLSSETTDSYSAPECPDDAILSTPECEANASSTVTSEMATAYYLNLSFDSSANQIYNNHIAVDQQIEEKIYISKTSPSINVSRGQIVPYKITVKNTLRSVLPPLGVVDTLPPGFKYVKDSGRVNQTPLEPAINGRQLRWDNLNIGYNQEHTIELLLMVGAGVSEGKYVNQAHVIDTDTGEQFSEVATATVRVVPDPTFDCTDVIGKVFDDQNLNGQQDDGEQGLPGTRVVTARGLIATSDEHGRFHITCAVVPDEDRGSNFILKLDDRSLPTGYRVVTENPRVQRATRGKMLKFNFGATIHRVVAIDIADGVFEPDSTQLRLQWIPKFDQLMDVLNESPAVLRLSYLADVESEGLVRKRLKSLKKEIADRWDRSGAGYQLTIETEVFWRRGSPP